jgi:hypothetical protein
MDLLYLSWAVGFIAAVCVVIVGCDRLKRG